MADGIWFTTSTLNTIASIATAINSTAKAINRLAKAQEDANEIEKRKVTTHSLTTVYLDDETDESDERG